MSRDESKLEEFLDVGGVLVIKKENGRRLAVVEIEIDGQDYHCGYQYKNTGDLSQRLDFFGECGLNGLAKKRMENEDGQKK